MRRGPLEALRSTAAAFGCLIAAGACGTAGENPVPSSFELSPSQAVVLADPPPAGAKRLRVRVFDIDNPAGGELGVRVAAVNPETAERREIGRFAVFPPEQTGDYVLPLAPAATAAFRDAASKVEFALTANTTADARLLVKLVAIWE